MPTKEKNLLIHLKRIFPEKVIYSDLYTQSISVVSYEIYRFAKAKRMSSIEWLISKGFIWKETGYVETDMQRGKAKATPQNRSVFALADYVFQNYPLAGEYHLSYEEDIILYQSASETVKKILHGHTNISAQEETVLVLETINLLKNWSSDLADEEISGSFWKYIFLQYGFNPENSDQASKRLYHCFQLAIKKTLNRYKRFFAPSGKRYYTTLLLHALAPKHSIDSLYSILFDFYVKNLDFQYVTEDISYKVFTKGMRARWDSRIAKNDELQLRGDTVFSGLQTLFKERPCYMAVLCDSIVQKMDAILRGEENMLDLGRNYWDILLWEWYQKKSNTERVRVQGERKQRKQEYIATTIDRIYAQYALEQEKVGIKLPKIRLASVEEQRPILKLYQKDSCIYETELSVTGNDLCLTTRSCFIPLKATSFDFTQSPDMRVDIQYGGTTLYNSDQKLYRKYIIFDSSGNEHSIRRGTAYLFAPNTMDISFADDTEGVYYCTHPGQMYRINLDEVLAVAVEGHEIFTNASNATKIRHYSSVKKVPSACVKKQDMVADIFSKPFHISIVLPKENEMIRYQLSLDGVRHTAGEFDLQDNTVVVPSINDADCHCIRVIDLEGDFVKYEINYIVLQDFRVYFNEPIYYEGSSEPAHADIRFADAHYQYPLELTDFSNSSVISIPGYAWQLELYTPIAHCTLMEQNGFDATDSIWYKNITGDEFVHISLPDGWHGKLMLGTTCVPETSEGCFELGNQIHAMSATQNDCDLWVALENDQHIHSHRKITTIAFRPGFSAAPLEVIDDHLTWNTAYSYIGDKNSTFRIEITGPAGVMSSYSVNTEDSVLEDTYAFTQGKYTYQVYLRKQRLFSTGAEEMIYSNAFYIGNPMEWMYEGKEIALGDALCWDFDTDALKTQPMQIGCGIISKLTYQGISIASGETTPAPCYQGSMYFIDRVGIQHFFNHQQSDEFEWINPVKVWIVNDHLIVLHCATDDAVYIDKRYNTIVNRIPVTYTNRNEQKLRLANPDYFEYSVREGK